jgi:hypothetical protein
VDRAAGDRSAVSSAPDLGGGCPSLMGDLRYPVGGIDPREGQRPRRAPVAIRDGIPAMNARPFRTAYELQDMIVEHAKVLHGPWPSGMTLFIFDDAFGWTASISRPKSQRDHCYRTRTFDLIDLFKARYDLDALRLSGPDDAWWLRG